jgi:hypothetical protein
MFKQFVTKKLTGSEEFKNTGDKHFSVQEFWSYGFSNLNFNVLRGVLAEFIVLNALKDDANKELRNLANGFDISYNDHKIEVKCCSYLQDWGEMRHSVITWVGLKADDLYSNSKTKLGPDGTIAYEADIYILALFTHQDHTTSDIMNMQQWCFYVLTRERLREISGNKNSLDIKKLEKYGETPVSFSGLRMTVDTCFCEPNL